MSSFPEANAERGRQDKWQSSYPSGAGVEDPAPRGPGRRGHPPAMDWPQWLS